MTDDGAGTVVHLCLYFFLTYSFQGSSKPTVDEDGGGCHF